MKKNIIQSKYPSTWWGAKWREAFPSGNGTIAAAVFGGVHRETVLLTHEALWHRTETEALPDVSGVLPELRKQMLAENPRGAEHLIENALKESGYDPEIGAPLPLADFKIHMPVQKGFYAYRRTLNMETGEVEVCWKDAHVAYSRKLFVSRPDDVIVMEVSSSTPDLVLDLSLDLHDRADVHSGWGEVADEPQDVELRLDPDGWLSYAARNLEDDRDFGAVARVCAGDGRLQVRDGQLCVEGGDRVLIVLKLFVKTPRQDAWSQLKQQLGDTVMDYQALLAPHALEHGEMYHRVDLDLGGDAAGHEQSTEEMLLDAYQGACSVSMVEKLWSYGRYLLISSSRPGGLPCPLHGKWCGSYLGYWTFHMANENLEMIYWQALSGNLAETHLPVFDYFDGMMDDFRENARKLYGCRGIYVPAVSTPGSGLLKTLRPHIIHWTGAAAWVAQHYYDYYAFTGDRNFLRDRAFPFLRETALFYEDFFILDEQGNFLSVPSNSPENTPGNYWDGEAMGESMETTINATMDFALAKEVLTHLLEAAAVLGIDGEEVEKWREMLGRIPAYQINEDGSVAEWMHPFFEDNNHHRHQSHIYPIFPGIEVTEKSDPVLFKAFEKSITKRLRIGLSEQTGWSLAHMANVYARLKNGNQALDCLNLMARSCMMNNFFTTHNDWRDMGIGVDLPWAPFQIDANMGWSAAIQEMLLFSERGHISILPALPDAWPKGSVSELLARGGVCVGISWDREAQFVSIELCSSKIDQEIEVLLPFGLGARKLFLKAGQTEILASSAEALASPTNTHV